MNDTLDLGNLMVHLKAEDSVFEKVLGKSEKKMLSMGKKLESIGKNLSLKLTAPLVAAGTVAAKFAISLESAFTGVRKTVNATEEEFQKLKVGFDDMARRIPVSIEELYGIGEAAGQLGIKKGNILQFTETMAALGVTTNLSAQEAASELARFANITQMNQQDFDRLGSTIVDLGNNLATTEAEIVSMALRMAGTGSIIGISEEKIVSLAAALSSVGMEAEAGGTAMSTMMLDMYKAVKQNTAELQTFAAVAGMPAKEFKESFEKDAAGTFVTFVEGLGKLNDAGTDITKVLETLGLDNVRVTRALLSAANAGTLFRDALNLGSKAWQENNALTIEAEKRYKTMSSRFTLLWNEMKLSLEPIGNTIADMFLNIVEKGIKPLMKWFGSLSEPTKQFIVNSALILAAIGPMLVLFGSLIKMLVIVKAAALLGAGSLSVLAGALGMILVAVAAWNLGTYFYNEFQIVQEVAANVATMLLNTWDRIAFGFKVMGATIKMIWKLIVASIKTLIGSLIGDLAKAIKLIENLSGKIPGVEKLDLGGVFLESFAKKLTAEGAKAVMAEYVGSVKEYNDELGKNIAANEQAYVDRMTEITKDFQKRLETKKEGETKGLLTEGEEGIQSFAIPDVTKDMQDQQDKLNKILLEQETGALGNIRDINKALDDEYKMLGMTNEERQRTVAIIEMEKAAQEAYGKDTEQYFEVLDAYTQKLDKVIQKQKEVAAISTIRQWAEDAGNIMQGLGDAMTSAFDTTADKITDVFMGVKTNFEEIAQSLLQDITNIIVKAMMAKAITSTLGAFGVPVFHGGGDVGGAAPKRMVSPLSFANAPRYHNGANEVPAILQRGERVLTEDEAESMDRGMMGQNVSVNFNVSAIDAQGTAQFFKNNKRIMASQIQNAVNSGHPLRKMMNR